MTFKFKVNDPHFLYQPRESQDTNFYQIWWLQLKSITSYRADAPNLLEFCVKMSRMTLKLKVNGPHFKYQL